MILSHTTFTIYSSLLFNSDEDNNRYAVVVRTEGLRPEISDWLDEHCPGWSVEYTDLLKIEPNSEGLPPLSKDISYVQSLHWSLDVCEDIEILFKLTFPEYVYSLDK